MRYVFGWDMIIVSIDVRAQEAIFTPLSICGPFVVVGTGYVFG